MILGFDDGQTDRVTDRRTTLVVKLLSRLKKDKWILNSRPTQPYVLVTQNSKIKNKIFIVLLSIWANLEPSWGL